VRFKGNLNPSVLPGLRVCLYLGHTELGNSIFVVGDPISGEAIVETPANDIDPPPAAIANVP
jgi:hypothetical protein